MIGDAGLRLDQEVRLGQEPREQHAVPMLVGAFLDEPRCILRARLRVSPVAELPAMRPQPIAQRALLGRQVLRRFRLAHAKLRHGLARAGLGHAPRLLDGRLKVLA